MIFVFDRNEKQISTLDVVPKIVEEIGKVRTLEFETQEELEKGYRIVTIARGKAYEFIVVDSTYERDDKYSYTYFCQDSIIELQSIPIMDIRPTGRASMVLGLILKDSRFVLEMRTGTDDSIEKSNYFYHKTAIEAFSEVINKYNLEWYTEYKFVRGKITERRIVIHRRDGRTHGRLEFGKNIKKFTRKILPDPIITAIIPFGKGEEKLDENGNSTGGYGRRIGISNVNGGLPYIENVQATEIYGYGEAGQKKPLYGFVIFEDEEDESNLLKLAEEELAVVSQVRAEHTVEAAHLGFDAVIGYEVPVVDDVINYRAYARIVKLVIIGDDVEVTFGAVTKSFTNTFQNQLRRTEKDIEKVFEQVNYAYQSADGKTTIYTGPDTPQNPSNDDMWFRENPDGTVDIVFFKDGDWIDKVSDGIFKELRDDLEASKSLIDEAKAAADKAVSDAQALIESIDLEIKGIDEKIKKIDGVKKEDLDEIRQKLSDTSDTTEMVAELVGGDGRTTYNKNRATVTEGIIKLGEDKYVEVTHNGDGFEVGKEYTISFEAECEEYAFYKVAYNFDVAKMFPTKVVMTPNNKFLPVGQKEFKDKKGTIHGVYKDTYTIKAENDWYKLKPMIKEISSDEEILINFEFKEIADGNVKHNYEGVWSDTPELILDGGGE